MPAASRSSSRRKLNRIVVNCGLPATSRESWRQVARATAAHSTVTFNDTSSARFVDSGPLKRMLHGMPIVGGPHECRGRRARSTTAPSLLRASHDGYADEFGVIHQRTLMLSADGSRLDGEDAFTPARASAVPTGRDAVRGALPPASRRSRPTG